MTTPNKHSDLVLRLRTRAAIRRSIPHRRSVMEGKPDRIADLLEEAADTIAELAPKPQAEISILSILGIIAVVFACTLLVLFLMPHVLTS